MHQDNRGLVRIERFEEIDAIPDIFEKRKRLPEAQ